MLNKIHRYITTNGLPQAPARILVALSGGGDSVALLLIMKQLGYNVIAVHCNFHLRGKESDRDENFVRNLCEEQQIKLYIKHFDTTNTAKAEGISIEMAARQLRYQWFEEMRQSTHSVAIAVAHHRDDNAETLLLNLIRGSGLRGLKGMLPVNGYIIRPLLQVSRKDLEKYLSDQSQTFVTDSTNLETQYKRNKIRHEILPLLRELNPSIDNGLAETARRMAETEILYDYAIESIQRQIIEHLSDGIRINIEALQKKPAPATLLHETLQAYGFSPAETAQIAQSLQLQNGKMFEAEKYLAVIHKGQLEVRLRPVRFDAVPLNMERSLVTLPNGQILHFKPINREELSDIPKYADKVAVDADCLKGKLYCKSIEEGDRFQPFGMRGTKLVSDYLTDRHRSVIDKLASCKVCDEEGIVWLMKERVSQRVAITKYTQRVLLINIESTEK